MKDDIELLSSKVRKLEITAKREVLDVFSGMYASAFKGRGIEMEDAQSTGKRQPSLESPM